MDDAFKSIKDAKGVPALITVFPYITSSSAYKDSPSSNCSNSKLSFESTYLTYNVTFSTSWPSGRAMYWIVAVDPDLCPVIFLPMKLTLEQNTQKEIVFREMIVSALRAISRGESPRNIQDQLLANLPPKQQEKIEAAAAAN